MAWGDIGAKRDNGGTASDLIKLEGQKRVRLLLPPTGPESYWSYTISTPSDDYRTWISPAKSEDFFAKNRRVFGLRPTHAGLAFDYDENAVKILEAGNQVWEQIGNLNNAGKDLSNRDILITKKGTGRSTEYVVVDMDPTPFPYDTNTLEKPDMVGRYTPATYEAIIEDLRQLGFTNPEQIFTTRPLSYEEAAQTKVPFGKNKDKTMTEVYNTDSQYLLFLATKIDREDIKEAARVMCNQLMGTNYELHGVAPSMDEITFVAPANDQQQQTPPPAGQPTQPPAPVAPPAPPAPVAPPAPPVGPQRPTNPQHIYAKPDGGEMWWNEAKGAWEDAPVIAPPAPPAPPVPPVPTPPVVTFDRAAAINEANGIFENDAKYKDFMLIINVLKEASAPSNKTSITDFTDEELQKLLTLIK